MKQFPIILKHELKTYFKNKFFIISTLLLVLIASGFLFAPRIIESFNLNQKNQTSNNEKKQILIKTAYPEPETLLSSLSQNFSGQNIKFTNDSLEQIKQDLKEQKIAAAFVINSDLKSYTYLSSVATVYDPNSKIMDETLKALYTNNFLHTNGLNQKQIAELQSLEISHKTEIIGEDGSKNFWYAYIMVFVLYMVVIIFGQKVTMSVVVEKTSRAMEVLVTSATPSALMFGKILASCIAGLFQIAVVFGSAYLSYAFNKTFFTNNMVVNALFNFPASLLGFMLIFFLLGYLIYSFLFGAMGSTISKIEDISSAVMVPQLIFIFSFIISINSMSSGDVNSTLMRVLSIIPFTSPMAMFTRIAMTEVPNIEIIISIILLILTTGLIGFLAAKIYRAGVLMYGTRPTLRKIIKAIREN